MTVVEDVNQTYTQGKAQILSGFQISNYESHAKDVFHVYLYLLIEKFVLYLKNRVSVIDPNLTFLRKFSDLDVHG
jgi:hypothetical protein